MPSSKGPVVDSPARTRNHAVTNQASDICLFLSSWKSFDIYPCANFVVKVSMAGTPYATQTAVSNFWCNFLSRKRKHARNLEQHHIHFKELLKHCAARAWHLVPLGNLCPPTSYAKKEVSKNGAPSEETGHTDWPRANLWPRTVQSSRSVVLADRYHRSLRAANPLFKWYASNFTRSSTLSSATATCRPCRFLTASAYGGGYASREGRQQDRTTKVSNPAAKSLRHMEADSSVPF